MKVTFILKDFTDAFFNGTDSGSIVGLLNETDADKFQRLTRMANEKRITRKIGAGQFRDNVELNQIVHKPSVSFAFKLEPRKGYKLATFDIN